ncbi:MAG: gamma-glutamyl-gamma-aminobutyrate hydrolase family protein [Deltaproteobacteria bacterium]|nr:gamma-glutamyl-gamma-aminobutyrate hydrolase family protein [Deltaproteobacteria bacterium]
MGSYDLLTTDRADCMNPLPILFVLRYYCWRVMRRMLVCQHVPYEILGTLNPYLRRAGFRMRYVNFGRAPEASPTLDGYDGLIILGGPMCLRDSGHHPHLRHEMRLIEEALVRDVPVLGICLGAQLIAATLGAAVGTNPQKEIGWYDLRVTDEGKEDPLFAHFHETERVFQWHGDTFTLPHSAVALAKGVICEHQAFRYQRHVYALQFHLEVDAALIERWLRVPHHKAEIAALAGTIDPETVRRDTMRHLPRSTALSHQTFQAFVDLFPHKPRR